MTQAYKLSVVMPCFNHGAFLREGVGSVLDAKREDTELIVVDDGSTDANTLAELDALRSRGICVVRQENMGVGPARNAGIRASHGLYIFPLDADDRLRAGWIDRAIQVVEANERVGVVYGDAQCFGARTDRWRTGPFSIDRLLYANYIHCSALYRRIVWEQNGGYDGTMPVQGFEDWDFWLGALEHGWSFAYVPQIVFDYRVANESMITRARPFEAEVCRFAVRKHGELYKREWERLEFEHRSVKATARNLGRLLKLRVRQKLGRDGHNGHSQS
jgi:glycosyltransferase involved in cell wall biosynthesis